MSLYDDLMRLVENNEAFYFTDYEVKGETYRVFNYRLASYTDFLEVNALEARGITFYVPPVDSGLVPICVSRPWKKFFNLGENPFTIGLDLSKIKHVAIKEDGSLISTYYNPKSHVFGVKSKQDFFSAQSQMAEKYLTSEQGTALRQDLHDLAKMGFTVIMELTSPANRIVIPYQETSLRVLGVRSTFSGEVIDKGYSIFNHFPNIQAAWVDEDYEPTEEFINLVPALKDIEGFVVTLEDGTMFKQKTDWYKSLHHLKDSVSSPTRLFDAIILETVDDVKTMFPDDKFQLDLIYEMESKVIPKYNHLIYTVEKFYDENKGLERKDYAIKGQKELGMLFTLAMNKFTGKSHSSSYRDFAIKYRKEYFGIEG